MGHFQQEIGHDTGGHAGTPPVYGEVAEFPHCLRILSLPPTSVGRLFDFSLSIRWMGPTEMPPCIFAMRAGLSVRQVLFALLPMYTLRFVPAEERK